MKTLDGVSIVTGPDAATIEQRAAAIAARQRGRVSRAQLLAARVPSSSIARLIARGYLWIAHPGVYVVGHDAEVPGGEQASALLALRPGARLSHGTALRWWEMCAPAAAPSAIHLTVPGNRSRGPHGIIVHRSTILTGSDARVHDGLPVTSPARTLLDVAALADHDLRTLERALDAALAHRQITRGDVRELLRRAGRHPGRVILRALLDAERYPTFTRSEAEERLLALIREAGLPQPLVNVRRHGYEIDFLWPDAGVAIEVDGYAFHAGRDAFERDRRRDQILLAAGVVVLRVTWRQLTSEPLAVAARVAAALARGHDR